MHYQLTVRVRKHDPNRSTWIYNKCTHAYSLLGFHNYLSLSTLQRLKSIRRNLCTVVWAALCISVYIVTDAAFNKLHEWLEYLPLRLCLLEPGNWKFRLAFKQMNVFCKKPNHVAYSSWCLNLQIIVLHNICYWLN